MDVRRHRGGVLLALTAFALTTAAVLGSTRAYAAWRARERVADRHPGAELVAFLRDDLPASGRGALAEALRGVPGVARVRVLSSDEALARMRTELGTHTTLLDGVEEGFLPATLEVTLQPGPRGVERADAIAWRLRRMEGIGEVDVLQTSDDHRLARADGVARVVVRAAIAAGAVAGVLGLLMAAAALRRRAGDSRVLIELGFTGTAVMGPAVMRGALVGGAGALLGAVLTSALGETIGAAAPDAVAVLPSAGGAAAQVTAGLAALALAAGAGALLGWWGARANSPERGAPDALA